MPQAKETDFEKLSIEELDEMHERIMRAKEAKAVERQNELIDQYQSLRAELIKAAVATEEQLPLFRRRGWKRNVRSDA